MLRFRLPFGTPGRAAFPPSLVISFGFGDLYSLDPPLTLVVVYIHYILPLIPSALYEPTGG